MMRREDRLFERFRRTHDPAALAEVFDRCARELLRVAVHLAGDVATAEDLVQGTFLEAIEHAQQFEAGRHVRGWLLGIRRTWPEDRAGRIVAHWKRNGCPEQPWTIP